MAETKTVTITNISCGHCTSTIEREVSEIEGVQSVQGDVESKQVTISWQAPATWEKITALLDEIEFPAQGA
jgi:copper chaperone